MTSRLPKVKDAVVRTPQGLLPATASAVPVLERGKKTSLSRKGKLICRYFQPNIRTTSKLEAGRACRTSSRYWSRPHDGPSLTAGHRDCGAGSREREGNLVLPAAVMAGRLSGEG